MRAARGRPRPRRRAAVADRHARGDRERRRLGRRDRRLDERRAPPACDRARVRDRLEIDDFDRIAARTPVIADMKPWGRFHATDVYRAGGLGLVTRELVRGGLVDGGRPTVGGMTLAASATAVVEEEGQEVVATDRRAGQGERLAADPARQPRPGRLRRQADRRPQAAPRAGARLRRRAVGVRRREGKGDPARRRGRDPLRRPGRRARDAGDAPGDRGDHRRGSRRLGRAHHRRALLRRDPRLHGRPRLPGGVPRRPDRRAPGGRHDHIDVDTGALTVELSDDELAARLAAWTAPPPRYTDGVFAKYAALVTSASEGAVTTS